MDAFDEHWATLEPPFRRALELAHQTLLDGGLPVGCVVTDATGAPIAAGRNRCYDPPSGDDPLEGTPLAHAELNALARLSTDADTDPAGLTLWTTHRPCSMCAAAIEFVEIGCVRVLAADPSAEGFGEGQPADVAPSWIVVATTMFLLGPALRRPDHPMLAANERREPESVRLTRTIVATEAHPFLRRGPLADSLRATWPTVEVATTERARRTE